jgi:rhodanese-related sulfurtransferase
MRPGPSLKEFSLDSRSAKTRGARAVTARQLKSMLHDGGEIAVLDVREEGVFAKRHMLLACSAPLSQLELRAPLLVPRRSARVVLVDDDNGLAQRAAGVLLDNGYTDVAILAGGVDAWAAAAFEIYSGVNVPSKAFGEFVEHHDQTPRMEAAEIKAKVERGEKIVILDSRPLHEYKKVSIPGGIDCPGAELAYRAHDMIPSPDTLVVVNCAGRTRSIIGAQSLINAGIPNRVVALKNGTMGWHLAGFQVAHDQNLIAPPPTAAGLRKAREAAARVAKRFGVQYIHVAKVAEFAREMDKRTLFLFDVRSPEEYAEGHLHSTVSAPGGQLVQTTDSFAGVRNARIVLVDDHGVRATMTASWLIQMGWKEVYVVKDALSSGPLIKGPAPVEALGLSKARCDMLSPAALKRALDSGSVTVVDLDSKPRYSEGHIPGAWHAIRANLAANLKQVSSPGTLVLTSGDGIVAQLASSEAAALRGAPVKVLRGGTDAWRREKLPLEQGMTKLTDTIEDVWVRAHDRTENKEQAMKEYLTWEIDLITQIGRDDDVEFLRFPA